MNAQLNPMQKIKESWAAEDALKHGLLTDAEQAGTWTTGIESDKRGRGTAINVDVIGWDETRGLAVVQVRECTFRPGWHNRVRKDYYLLGRVESGAVFAHAIESPLTCKKARESRSYCIDHVLSKIWDCTIADLGDIERQGDIALIPVCRIPEKASPIVGPITLRDSHVLTGDIWLHDDVYYTRRGATLKHLKGEHASIKAKAGYYRVQPGARASTWGFSAPTAD